MKHLPAIDGLRAIAVLAVVAYHAGLPVPAGFVGVDIFFVISGYVITRMLRGEQDAAGRIDLLAFYARRVRRLLPALLVVVVVTLAASAVLLSAEALTTTTHSAMAAMALSSNVFFQMATGGYFDPASDEMPLLHLWSLSVEEQFYLAWPVMLVAFRRRPWVIAALAAASLALAIYWTDDWTQRELAFYQIPARFWEIAVGGIVAILPASRLGAITAPLGLAAIAYSIVKLPEAFPGLGAALPVFGTCLVLHAIHGGTKIAPLELRPIRYVGLISYSLYIWHWPLLALYRASTLEPPTLQANLLLCAAGFVLAVLSYHFIETPFRRGAGRSPRVIGFGVAACVALAGCAAAVSASAPADDFSARLAKDFPAITSDCHAQRVDAPRLPDPAICGDGKVVLWGDSHAYAWRPFADRFGSVYQMTRAGCAPSAGNPGSRSLCDQYDYIAAERARQGEIVILAARWSIYSTGEGAINSALDVLRDVPRVIVMGPLPEMPYPLDKCIAKRRLDLCAVSRREFDAKAEPIRDYLRRAVASHPNAEFIDPADHFCTATSCPMMKGERSLYWDQTHITASAAGSFSP